MFLIYKILKVYSYYLCMTFISANENLFDSEFKVQDQERTISKSYRIAQEQYQQLPQTIESHPKFSLDDQQSEPCMFNQVKIEAVCLNCHYSCQTCFGLGHQHCLDCNQLNNRIQLDQRCICQPKYYALEYQSTCKKCHASCQTCFGETQNDCLSCIINYRLIEQTCVCDVKNYLNKVNMECELCHFSCQSCIGPQNTDCLSCSKISLRKIFNYECLCPLGFFSNSSNEICEKCNINCISCKTFQECLSCSNDQILNANKNCICQNGFTMDITNQICYQCHKTCLTCYGYLINNCLSCPINSVLKPNNQCLCADGYYLLNNQCQPCNSNCLTCQYSDKFCLTCSLGFVLKENKFCCKSNNIIVNNLCTCAIGQYMDIDQLCQSRLKSQFIDCLAQCQSCSNGNSCSECKNKSYQNSLCQTSCSGSNSIECDINNHCLSCTQDFLCNASSGNCECPSSRYYNNNSIICKKCERYDSHCNQCDNSSCLNCFDSYYLENQVCKQCINFCSQCSSNVCSLCNLGYFGSNCQPCDHHCQNCVGTGQYSCTECKADSYMAGNSPSYCYCKQQYYEDTNNNCILCHSTCQTCSSSSFNCTNCNPSQNRTLSANNKCDCSPGYSDFGLDECYKANCGYGCGSCNINGGAYTCSSCLTSGTQRLNDPSNNCPCIDGFYDNQQRICQQCPYECATCKINSGNILCTKCKQNRNYLKQCMCSEGFYEKDQNCFSCEQNCLRCIDENICTQCENSNLFLTMEGKCVCSLDNYKQNSCNCQDGYFVSANLKCLPCLNQCKTCSISNFQCTTCSDSHLFPPACACSPGFYVYGQEKLNLKQNFVCLPCKNNCILCENENICLDCQIPFILKGEKCVCPQKQYFDTILKACLQCSPQCENCEFHQDYCTKCSFNRIRPHVCDCPTGMYQAMVNQSCLLCEKQCKSCSSSSSNCQECSINRILPPTCGCQDGFFENLDFECKPCNSKCQKCINASQNCLTCSQIDALTPNCECLDGYFYDQQQGCIKCNQRCLTCIGSDEYNCLSCDPTKLLKLQLNKCVCEQNYYYLDNQCNICTIDIYECQTNYCGDGIKQNNEECDDWNNFNRDGCSNICTIENEYSCELVQNFQLHSSIIYSQCTKCSPYCSQCKRNQCLQCYNGYFITKSYDCQKCNFHCKECKGPNQKDCLTCITGQDYGLQEKCAFCEETQGLYTKGNVCVSKCGDGIKKQDEQCDDGNIINTDGCSQFCKIEEDWGCSNQDNTLSTCQKLNIPIATLQFDRPKDFYQSFRNGQILFSKPMIISDQAIISNWEQILINQNDSSYQIISTLQFNTDNQVESIILEIEIMATIENIIYQIDFTSGTIKDGIEGYPLKTKVLSATLGKYFQLSQQTISTTKTSQQFGTSVLITLGGITFVGLMLGSLEFYWNALDNLQILSYITFINVNFPYMHNQFLGIFTFARFEFINSYFNIDVIKNLENEKNEKIPLIIEQQTELNFFINISSVCILWISPICLMLLSTINVYFINTILVKKLQLVNFQDQLNKYNIFKQALYKFICLIYHLSIQYYNNFFFTIIIRVYLSSLYDLNFCIFTQFYCWLWTNIPSLMDKVAFIIASSLVFLQVGVLFILSQSLTINNYEMKTYNFKTRFRSFYEGIKFSQKQNRLIQFFQPIRKIVFMGTLILCYDYAIYQISLLISIQLMSTLALIKNHYYLNILETIKGLVQDIGLSLSLSLCLLYYLQDTFQIFNQDIIENLSYIHTGIYSLMLLVCLIIDLWQQAKIILKKYSYIRNIHKICEKKEDQQKSYQSSNNNLFLDLTFGFRQQINKDQNQSKNEDYIFSNIRLY